MTLSARFGVSATATRAANNPHMADMGAGSSHWRVTLRRTVEGRRRSMTVPFSMGAAHTGPPSADDVLRCLCDDSCGYDNAQGFEDWAAEYGFDADSRKAESTFRAVQRQAARLRVFLGDEYEAAVYGSEEEAAEACRFCRKWAEKGFQCSAATHGECDCPKCQGMCECHTEEGEG